MKQFEMISDSLTPANVCLQETAHESALRFLPEANRIWLRSNIADSFYANGMSDYVHQQTGHQLHPDFYQDIAPDGTPLYLCVFRWGKRECSVRIESGLCSSTGDALNKALEMLKIIPVDRVVNWEQERITRLNFRVMSPVVFRNTNKIGIPSIECTLTWGRKEDIRTVTSVGHLNRSLAFEAALAAAKEIGDVPMPLDRAAAAAIPKKKPIIQPEKLQPIKQDLKVPVNRRPSGLTELIAEGMIRWRSEREWLMKRPTQSHSQIQRLHRLTTFLILMDPLRRYEIDLAQRAVSLNALFDELTQLSLEYTPSAKAQRSVDCLRILAGKNFADAGTELTVSKDFIDGLNEKGLSEELVIDDLIRRRLIRREGGGKLAMSTLGANLLEREISSGVKKGSIAAALPDDTVRMLADLKFDLTNSLKIR